MPVGENGRLNLAYREARNQPWGYGYGYPGRYGLAGPGFYSPYGVRGRGYGGDTTSKSLSMGFSWSKDRDQDDRDPFRGGCRPSTEAPGCLAETHAAKCKRPGFRRAFSVLRWCRRGIEPTTSALPRMRSTTELRRPRLRKRPYSQTHPGREAAF